LENRIRNILEYELKNINLKTMFKSNSENRIRKNINSEKHFSKTIYEGKIGFLKGLEETWGEDMSIIWSVLSS
jgi:hypothetical protein